MKNFYSLLTLMLFGTLVMAQENITIEDTKAEPARPGAFNNNFQDRATPFWTEDFSGGFPGTWTIIDSSNICPWTYSNDGSWGFFSNTGETSGDAAISSTTAGNGFMICDQDSANNVNYGQPSGTTYQYLSSYFETDAVDCSTHPSVILRFEHSYRYNNGVPMIVQVSTDGTTWTAFDVSDGTANNAASADPDVQVLNLSTIAGGQSTVYLRFGWSARVYYWMIDDISLSEADANDVSLESGYWGAGTFQYQHYKIPSTQVSPVTFYGGISNATAGPLNDVYFDVDVSQGASVFSGTSSLLNLTSSQLDTAASTTDWSPSGTGYFDVSYTADLQGATDDNLTNNTSADQIEMTNSVYALDNLPTDLSGSSGGISNFSGNGGSAFGIGNVYEIIADDEIECIDLGITTAAANEGNPVYGAIYYWDGAAWTYLAQTPDYTVEAADLGAIKTVSFTTPVSVTAGQELLVVGAHYGGTDVQFMMAQSVPDAMVWGYDVSLSFFWLGSPRAIVARPNFSCAPIGIGYEELASSSFNCYPNPATDVVNIELELTEDATIQIQLLDINGKVVMTEADQKLITGTHVLAIDTDKFAKGVYSLEIKINGQVERQKIVLQ